MRKGVGTFGPSTWSSVGGGIRVQTAGLSLLRPLLAMGILLPVVLLQGCIKNPFAVFNPAAPEVSASPESPPEDSAVAPSPILGKKVVLPSGLMYIDLVLGTGPSPGPGNLVTVHYTQTLDDGRTFDSSREREPLTFRWGVGDVIPGWDEGLKTMRQGGRRKLIVPPNLAFGDEGRMKVVPPGATIICDIELLTVDLAASAPLESDRNRTSAEE